MWSKLNKEKVTDGYQWSQFYIGGCTGLISEMIYFDTSQYRCTILDLPLFIYIYIYMYVYVCVYIYIYIIINIKVYHKTLPQFKTNYPWF